MSRGDLRWDSAWAFVVDGADSVTASAGSDLTYQIDGLAPSAVAKASGWANGDPVKPENPHEQGLADHLVNIGALRLTHDGLALSVVGQGRLADALRLQIRSDRFAAHPDSYPDSDSDSDVDWGADAVAGDGSIVPLKIVVLDSPDNADRQQPVDGLHLFVDATAHHTLVIGPFVIPGFSACGTCWQRRFARRWKPLIASEPRVAKSPTLIAELLAIQVDSIRRWSSPIINATIAWDLEQGTVRRDDLLRVPDCEGCDHGPHSSELALPYDTLAPIRGPVDR